MFLAPFNHEALWAPQAASIRTSRDQNPHAQCVLSFGCLWETQWLHTRAVSMHAHRPADCYSHQRSSPTFQSATGPYLRRATLTLFRLTHYSYRIPATSLRRPWVTCRKIDTRHWNWDRWHMLDHTIHPGSSTALNNQQCRNRYQRSTVWCGGCSDEGKTEHFTPRWGKKK